MSEPLHTENVPAKEVYKDIKGRPFIDKNPNKAALAIEVARGRPKEYERVSTKHGRSMTESASSKKSVWAGPERGDIYGASTVKGTAMYQKISIEVYKDEEGYVRFKANGLMEDKVVPRIKEISLYMRKNGLPTEMIRSIKKLEFVYIKEDKNWKKIPINEWKQKVLEEAKFRNEPNIDALKNYLEKTDFIALERDVQVDERLVDLKDAILEGRLKNFLKPIFKWLNAATYGRDGGLIYGTPSPGIFNLTDTDIKRYIIDFLPTQMGLYLGRFHRLGLTHRYLHDQNWTAVGTVVDLDSVEGDSAVRHDHVNTDYDFAKDLEQTVNEVRSLADIFARHYNLDTEQLYKEILGKFVLNYFRERKVKDFDSIRLNKYDKIFGNGVGKEVLDKVRTELENINIQ